MSGVAMDWFHAKELIVDATGLSRDTLHIVAGILGQLLVALIVRRSLASPVPWLALALVLAANEAYDLHYERWPDRSEQWAGTWSDVVMTMAVPTALLLAARLLRWLRARRASAQRESFG